MRNKDNLFCQFPGSSDEYDSSTSTMLLYCFSFMQHSRLTKNEVLSLFVHFIDKDGSLLRSSGDTLWLNKYSNSFGKSELSQGMLLLLLSRENL